MSGGHVEIFPYFYPCSGLSCTSYCVCEGGNNCCNPHTQQEEDEDEPQQSDVDSDDLAGEESD